MAPCEGQPLNVAIAFTIPLYLLTILTCAIYRALFAKQEDMGSVSQPSIVLQANKVTDYKAFCPIQQTVLRMSSLYAKSKETCQFFVLSFYAFVLDGPL